MSLECLNLDSKAQCCLYSFCGVLFPSFPPEWFFATIQDYRRQTWVPLPLSPKALPAFLSDSPLSLCSCFPTRLWVHWYQEASLIHLYSPWHLSQWPKQTRPWNGLGDKKLEKERETSLETRSISHQLIHKFGGVCCNFSRGNPERSSERYLIIWQSFEIKFRDHLAKF